ncbi:MAG: hypothetical protein 1 [Zeugodacus cucurbitae negev-like virus]|nr:MAG: hypothetical protein 1 [Zeugodacus cucurbitae negev-like virus]
MYTNANNANAFPPVADLSKVFGSIDADYSNKIIESLISSRNENSLKNVFSQHYTDLYHSHVNNKAYTRSVCLTNSLNTDQLTTLSNAYPGFKLSCSNIQINSHAMAASSRHLEYIELLYERIRYDVDNQDKYSNLLATTPWDTWVKDVGGDPTKIYTNDTKYMHSCSPVLINNAYDSVRHTSRLINAYTHPSMSDQHINVMKSLIHNESNITTCRNLAQKCTVKAPFLMFVQSIWDMSLTDVADAMDSASALIGYGTFIYSDEILIHQSGSLKELGVWWEYTKPIKNRQWSPEEILHYSDGDIIMGFEGDDGYNYVHNLANYKSFLTTSRFCSSKKQFYNLELLENRIGVQYFKITRECIKGVRASVPHTVHLKSLKDKYILSFYKDSAPGRPCVAPSPAYLGDDITWIKDLQPNLTPIRFPVDSKLVDSAQDWVSAVKDNLKPHEILNWLRNSSRKAVHNGAIVQKNSELNSEQQNALARVLYIITYEKNYQLGKIIQQLQSDLDTNRSYMYSPFNQFFAPRNYMNINQPRSTSIAKTVYRTFVNNRRCILTTILAPIQSSIVAYWSPRLALYSLLPTALITYFCLPRNNLLRMIDVDKFLITNPRIKYTYKSVSYTNHKGTVFNLGIPSKYTDTEADNFVRKIAKEVYNCDLEGPLKDHIINLTCKDKNAENSPLLMEIPKDIGEFQPLTIDIPTSSPGHDTVDPSPSSASCDTLVTCLSPISSVCSEAPTQITELSVEAPRSPSVCSPMSPTQMSVVDESESFTVVDIPPYGNCCFIAANESRVFDIEKFKKDLLALKLNDDRDYIEELSGAWGGRAFLDTYGKHMGIRYFIHCPMVEEVGHDNPTRCIHLKYNGSHYDLYVPKHSGTPSSTIHYLHSPIPPSIFDRLNRYIQYLDITDHSPSGYYYSGNLQHYCHFHIECENNSFQRTLDVVINHPHFQKSSFIFLFEIKNFSTVLFNKVCQQFNLIHTLHFIPIHGYIVISIMSGSPKKLSDMDIKTVTDHLAKCPCGKDNFVPRPPVFNNNALRYCQQHVDEWSQICPSETDLTIKIFDIKDTIDAHQSFGHRHPDNKTFLFYFQSDGHSVKYQDDTIDLLEKHLSLTNRANTTAIHVISRLSNVSRILKAISRQYEFVATKTIEYLASSRDTTIGRTNDLTPLDVIVSTMEERREIWRRHPQYVTESLRKFHQTAIDRYEKGLPATAIDLRFHLYDVKKGKIVCGTDVDTRTLHWVYDGTRLVEIDKLARESIMSKTSSHYVSFNQHSLLIPAVYIYQLVKDIDITTMRFNTAITEIKGVPGAGKTEYILNNCDKNDTVLLLTVSREAKDDMIARLHKRNVDHNIQVATVDSFFIHYHKHHSSKDYKQVWFDEALLTHAGDWLWVAYLTRTPKLIIAGDRAQIPYIERTGYTPRFACPQLPIKNCIRLYTSHRCPIDVVNWLNTSNKGVPFYDSPVTTKSSISNSLSIVHISSIADVPCDMEAHYLVFTQSELNHVKNSGFKGKICTVHQFQGNQNSKICLIRTEIKDAYEVHRSVPHILVALTRHTHQLIYYTVIRGKHAVADIITTINSKRGGGAYFDTYREVVTEKSSTRVVHSYTPTIRNLNDKMGFGAYIPMRPRISYIIDQKPRQPSVYPDLVSNARHVLQDFHDKYFHSSLTTDPTFDHDLYQQSDKSFFGDYTITENYKYSTKLNNCSPALNTCIRQKVPNTQAQVIKAFCERNGAVPELKGFVDDESMADRLVDSLLKVCNRELLAEYAEDPLPANCFSLSQWLAKQPLAVQKLIDSDPVDLCDKDLSVYSFTLKGNAKPDLDPGPDERYKSSQTIAFPEKLVNAIFCPIFSDITTRLNAILPPNIVLFNRMSIEEYCSAVDTVCPFERFQKLDNFIEVDFSKYDKSQDLTTLYFEIKMMKLFGVPDELISMWVVLHRTTHLVDHRNLFRATVHYQRKSGDGATYIGNTMFNMAVLLYTLDIHSLINNQLAFCTFSGDDSLIFTPNVSINLAEASYLCSNLFNLEVKLLKYRTPYFCSKFFIPTPDGLLLVPDVIKTIVKLGRCDLVNRDHVKEYFISFSDNNKLFNNPYLWDYIAHSMNDRYGFVGNHYLTLSAISTLTRDFNQFNSLWDFSIDHQYSILPSLEI